MLWGWSGLIIGIDLGAKTFPFPLMTHKVKNLLSTPEILLCGLSLSF